MRAQGATTRRSESDSDPAAPKKHKWPYRFSGYATYYSDSLAGNHTASGERYNPRAFTAASRNLPFGTLVRVTRPDKGLSVVVRINDRGPFGDSKRILDLSRAAATKLKMLSDGVVRVRIKILRFGPKKTQAKR